MPKDDTQCPHCGAEQGISGWLAAAKSNAFREKKERRVGSLCVSCGKLVGIDDTECPYCGVKQTAARKMVSEVSSALPTTSSITNAILFVLFVLWVLPIFAMSDIPGFDLAEYLKKGILSGVNSDLEQPAVRMGINHGPLLEMGQYWRLLTATFLHFGIWHIGFNAYALHILGRMTEDLYDRYWFIFLYVMTGVVANVISWEAHGIRFIQAGASGSIFGLMGVGIVYCWQTGWRNKAVLNTLITWSVLSIGFGFMIGADNWAHVGGMAAGGLFTWVLPPSRTNSPSGRKWGKIAGMLTIASVIVCFGMAIQWSSTLS